MAAEKTFTLTSSQLCALKDFVICAHSKATIPQLLSDAVPKDVAAALGQHFGTLHMLPAPGLAAPKGKKGKKEENGASTKRKLNADGTERELRLLSSYNLYQQRMQSLEQLHKDLPVWKAVNPDGTKRSMVTYAEVWKTIPQASKDLYQETTKELLKVINLLREQHPGTNPKTADGVTQLGLIAAYEHLHPKQAIPQVLGLTTSNFPASVLSVSVAPPELDAAVRYYTAHKDLALRERTAPAKKAKKAPAEAATVLADEGAAAAAPTAVVAKKEKKGKGETQPAQPVAVPAPAAAVPAVGKESKKAAKAAAEAATKLAAEGAAKKAATKLLAEGAAKKAAPASKAAKGQAKAAVPPPPSTSSSEHSSSSDDGDDSLSSEDEQPGPWAGVLAAPAAPASSSEESSEDSEEPGSEDSEEFGSDDSSSSGDDSSSASEDDSSDDE